MKKKTTKRKVRKTIPQIKVYKTNRAEHLKNDKRLKAKPVGKRKSASGRTYSERRENRSDRNPKTRL